VNYSGSELNSKNVTDGTSNTYMLGEKHVDPLKYYDGHEWGDDWGMYTGQQDDVSRMCYCKIQTIGGVDLEESTAPIQDTPGTGNSYPESQQFGSAHPSGMNMAFCDGSVHFISYEIDGYLHSILSNRHDGEVVNLNAL
jgi:prepilin-type processing-associated H-X9-DG protein